MANIPLVFRRRLSIDIKRYAIYSHPWTSDKEGRIELSCTECRDRDMPLVIGAWEKTAVLRVVEAMEIHEGNSHYEVASLKTAA